MTIQNQKSSRQQVVGRQLLRVAVLAATLTALGSTAMVSLADSPNGMQAAAFCKNPDGQPGHMKEMRAQRLAFMQRKLDNMANRLQITASQQPVWDQYKKARMDMMPKHFIRPGPDMNAAQLAQFRAKRAEIMAKKMQRLSEATSRLRAVLNPNQQQVLDEMVRHPHHPGHAHGRGQMPDHRPDMP